jgi:hypothetical protein
MRKRGFISLLCIGCAIVIASPSWATIVEPGVGDLSINQGKGFKPVKHRINASVGDAVMVGPGGTATLTYDDGCKVKVQPGAVITIAPLSPCAAGSNAAQGSWLCDAWQVCVFWGVYAVVGSLIGYEISQIGGPTTITSKPASP